MKPPKFICGETGHADSTSRVVARPTHPCILAASSIGILSLTLSPSPLIVLAMSSPMLPLQMHESSMSPRYPPQAPSQGGVCCCTLQTGCPCLTWHCGLWQRSPCSISDHSSTWGNCSTPQNLLASWAMQQASKLWPHISMRGEQESKEWWWRLSQSAMACGNVWYGNGRVWQHVAPCSGWRRAAGGGQWWTSLKSWTWWEIIPLKYLAKSDSLYHQCLILSSFCCLAYIRENRDALVTNRIVETIAGACHTAEPVIQR